MLIGDGEAGGQCGRTIAHATDAPSSEGSRNDRDQRERSASRSSSARARSGSRSVTTACRPALPNPIFSMTIPAPPRSRLTREARSGVDHADTTATTETPSPVGEVCGGNACNTPATVASTVARATPLPLTRAITRSVSARCSSLRGGVMKRVRYGMGVIQGVRRKGNVGTRRVPACGRWTRHPATRRALDRSRVPTPPSAGQSGVPR